MTRKHTQQPDTKETKQFWNKTWQPREHNKKSRMEEQHSERDRMTRRGTESGNTYRFTENDTKNTKLESAM